MKFAKNARTLAESNLEPSSVAGYCTVVYASFITDLEIVLRERKSMCLIPFIMSGLGVGYITTLK